MARCSQAGGIICFIDEVRECLSLYASQLC